VKKIAALLLAAVLLTLAAGCQRERKKVVAVIPKGTSHIFWLTVQAGALAAGEQFNLEILWNGPAQETEYSRQVQIVDSMVSRRVDGIVVAAADRKALVQSIDRATAAGIPVTVFDSGLDSENFMSYVATDNFGAGQLGGREVGRLLGGQGTVAILMHVPGSVSTTDRERGFEDAIAKEFPGIAIVARQFGMSDRSRSLAAAENILAAHPELNGFFCSTEPSCTGLALALKGRGMAGRVKVVGFDSNEAMVEDLRNGVYQALVVQDPFRIGFEAVKTISQKLDGVEPPKRLDLPPVLVTPDKLNDPEIQKLINPDVKKYLRQ
jgi:ribose transport system substrate-binding protein